MNHDTTQSKAEHIVLKAVYQARIVTPGNQKYLTNLMEQYADIGVNRLLNRTITEDEIHRIGQTGLKVMLEYPEGKMLTVSGYSMKVPVNKIYILSEQQTWTVVFLDNTRLVLVLKESEASEIFKCLALE